MNGFNNPSDSTPLPYTSSPLELLVGELRLIKDILLCYPASIPGVLRPFWSWKNEDELCLRNTKNIKSLLLHAILIISQSLFLIALVYALIIPVPASAYLSGIAISLTLNYYFCFLLNGDGSPQTSATDLSPYPNSQHEKECWIFINGVSVGRDWFQSNLDTLSLIFRRPITGVHNITYGIIFDLIECLIQRDSCYATTDIRTGYAQVKKALLDDGNEKVVLLVHSQGGIEGGAILDWLLDDLPAPKLAKLEIYTFGSAANHFNNPHRHHHPVGPTNPKPGVIRHIEHYTNSGDFVSRFGILGFIRLPERRPNRDHHDSDDDERNGQPSKTSNQLRDDNRFRGRLFKRNATGHMLNQHYLAYMFQREKYTLPNGQVGLRVAEHNEFMDHGASVWDGERDRRDLGWRWPWRWGFWGMGMGKGKGKRWECMVSEDGVDLSGREFRMGSGTEGRVGRKPRELSRLWRYRNGMTPGDEHEDGILAQGLREQEQEQEQDIQQEEENVRIGNGNLMNGFAKS